MPGQTILSGDTTANLSAVLERYCFDERYHVTEQTLADTIAIAWNTYSGYPVAGHSIKGRRVWVEGKIYNHPDNGLDGFLADIVAAYDDNDMVAIQDQLLAADGEYLITIDNGDGSVATITDPLGRLPLGYFSNDELAILTRHKLAITDIVDNVGIDPFDAACFLHWGFTIGGRSLFEGVNRVPPAAIVELDGASISVETYYKWRVDEKPHANRDVKTNAAELARLFEEGVRRRAADPPATTVVLLSGGLDSRSILAPLSADGDNFVAATRNHPDIDAQQDITIARELSNEMDIDWSEYRVETPSKEDINTHLTMKGGLDPINISHQIPFLDQIRREYPGATLMSGSGGDKLMPDLRPSDSSIDSEYELVEYLFKSAGSLPANTVTDITGIPEEEIKDYLLNLVHSYPEDDIEQKHIHFKIFERMYSWLFESGDANRCYAWNTSPFYTLEFFRYAIGVPDWQKTEYQLFREWLQQLDPRLVDIRNANTQTRVGSVPHQVQLKGYKFLTRHPEIFDVVRPVLKSVLQGDSGNSGPIEYPIDTPTCNGLLSDVELSKYLFDQSYPRNQRYQLLTLAATKELISE